MKYWNTSIITTLLNPWNLDINRVLFVTYCRCFWSVLQFKVSFISGILLLCHHWIPVGHVRVFVAFVSIWCVIPVRAFVLKNFLLLLYELWAWWTFVWLKSYFILYLWFRNLIQIFLHRLNSIIFHTVFFTW